MYHGEIHRCVDWVELREKLRLNLDITDEKYRSEHSVQGEIRSRITPDREVIRSREYPPAGVFEKLLGSVTDNQETMGKGYPGTELVIGITRVPPTTQRDEESQQGVRRQNFTVNSLPKNGTIRLDGDWDVERARECVTTDEQKSISHTYEVEGMPSDQLPLVVRADLHRDAREYLENIPSTIDQRDEREQKRSEDPKKYEGQAVLSIEIEYREDSPERNIAAGSGILQMENLRAEMQSTFPDLSFRPDENSTYNPEKKRIEWRNREARPGETLRYDIFGRMEELLDLGKVSVTLRGRVNGDTLTGTFIDGLYDRTGNDLTTGKQRNQQGGAANRAGGQRNEIKNRPSEQIETAHGVRITGDINIDPPALRSESRKVTDATVSLNDTPSDAYERLRTVCDREGMMITSSSEPKNPEPAEEDGVFIITKGEKADGDDEPGELEVKREYGDQGVVYAHMYVYGRYTSMTQDREVSKYSGDADRTDDQLVRADQGGLEKRGKSTIDIRARSADAELNSEFVSTIQDGLGSGKV